MAEFALHLVPGSLVDLSLHTRGGLREQTGRVVWQKTTRGVVQHGFAFPTPNAQDFALDFSRAQNRWEGRESGPT
ncbi:MAG: hypothetical protein ACM335_05490 [Deltaproteobacteria bacterium]